MVLANPFLCLHVHWYGECMSFDVLPVSYFDSNTVQIRRDRPDMAIAVYRGR